MAGKRPRRSAWRSAKSALVGLGLGVLVLAGYAELKFSRLVLGGLGESFSSRIYSAPFRLDESIQASPDRVLARLKRLGYRKSSEAKAAGQYSWNPPVLSIGLRGFKSPMASQAPGLFEARSVADRRWQTAAPLLLEPETVSELSGRLKVRRDPARAEEIPALLKQAVITAEDKRFYSHFGIDPRAILRAAWRDLTGHGALSGASTITQQLAKNILLTPRRTFWRKALEAFLALYLELRRSKEEILTLYLNHIYWGQDGATSVAGARAAARFYFGKDLPKLSLEECALLAGMIRSPNRYNPRRDPEEAKGRRDFILRRMQEGGLISVRQMRQAIAAPVKTVALPKAPSPSGGYFAAEVERELSARYGEDVLFRYGLSIYTTMDPLLQASAERALAPLRHQGALVALDPASGRVLALAGGRSFKESSFNRATQSRRQPGSAFKPFVYGAALEEGFTPASLLDDRKRVYPGGWAPRNFDGVYAASVTVRYALSRSLNLATLDAAQRVGMAKVAAFAQRMGIESPLDPSLAAALGDSGVGLLELAAAYAPFANGGARVAPGLIEAVGDAEGGVMEYSRFERKPVLSPPIAYLLTSMLETAVSEGTGRPLAQLDWTRPTAGKTGTTNDGRDAWFVGYTPRLLAGVWVGDDADKSLKLTGAKDAIPVWAAFMREAERDAAPENFAPPESLVRVKIDPASGLLARSGCPDALEEEFIPGSEPKEFCPLHAGGVVGWFQKFFRRR